MSFNFDDSQLRSGNLSAYCEGSYEKKYIILHNTANKFKSAQEVHQKGVENNVNYIRTTLSKPNPKGGLNATAHFFVGGTKVAQVAPETSYVISCEGTGASDFKSDCANTRGSKFNNKNSINIEMVTYGTNGDQIDATTEQTAQELTAMLCKKFNIPIENIYRHYDFNGKHCPVSMTNHTPGGYDRWIRFKQGVANKLGSVGVMQNGSNSTSSNNSAYILAKATPKNKSASYIKIYEKPDPNAKSTGKINKGEEFKVKLKTKNSGTGKDKMIWYELYDKKGYVKQTAIEKIKTVTPSSNKSNSDIFTTNGSSENAVIEFEKTTIDQSSNLAAAGHRYTNFDQKTFNKTLKNINFIFGMPYQLNALADPRINIKINTSKKSKTFPFAQKNRKELPYGRVFNEKIVSKMPLLLVTPGQPNFLPGYSKSTKAKILKILNSTLGASVVKRASKGFMSNLDSVMSKKTGRYYTFHFDYASYYNYVNQMLRYCAIMLGIGNWKYPIGDGSKKVKLKHYKWQDATNPAFTQFVAAPEAIAFYVDAETNTNESLSTSTTTSQFASSINGLSDIQKELQFLIGPMLGFKRKSKDVDAYNRGIDDVNKIIDESLGGSRLFKNLAESFKVIGAGGKLIFPEIWSDTDFSKSYDFTLKLRTPSGDKVSWYLEILVPMIHWIALAAPRQLGSNGYQSPFLVRAFYKGIFNLDMGIVTSLDISKGKEGMYTVDGLPTEVDIRVSMKDLYSMLYISNDYTPANMLNNTCLTDYLANTCGININKPEVMRTLELLVLYRANYFKDMPNRVFTKFQQNLSNLALDLYDKLNLRW